jgi:hypothetical protein
MRVFVVGPCWRRLAPRSSRRGRAGSEERMRAPDGRRVIVKVLGAGAGNRQDLETCRVGDASNPFDVTRRQSCRHRQDN